MDLTASTEARSDQLGMVRRPAIDRFAEKIALADSGCIEWLARRIAASEARKAS